MRNRLRFVTMGLLSTGLLSFGSALAWADDSIVLDLVRHGQSVDNAAGIIDTTPPGTGLTQTGYDQANTVAQIQRGSGPRLTRPASGGGQQSSREPQQFGAEPAIGTPVDPDMCAGKVFEQHSEEPRIADPSPLRHVNARGRR